MIHFLMSRRQSSGIFDKTVKTPPAKCGPQSLEGSSAPPPPDVESYISVGMSKSATRIGPALVRSAGAHFVPARTIASTAQPAARAAQRHTQLEDSPSFAQLVAESFEGSILRYSKRLALLEEADERDITRIEARQVIDATRKRAQAANPKRSRGAGPMTRRVVGFATFATSYSLLASAWCWVMR